MFVLSARQNVEQRGSSQMPISEKDQFSASDRHVELLALVGD
jgi:hypothetical protein